jgi:hypothetical protein
MRFACRGIARHIAMMTRAKRGMTLKASWPLPIWEK